MDGLAELGEGELEGGGGERKQGRGRETGLELRLGCTDTAVGGKDTEWTPSVDHLSIPLPSPPHPGTSHY